MQRLYFMSESGLRTPRSPSDNNSVAHPIIATQQGARGTRCQVLQILVWLFASSEQGLGELGLLGRHHRMLFACENKLFSCGLRLCGVKMGQGGQSFVELTICNLIPDYGGTGEDADAPLPRFPCSHLGIRYDDSGAHSAL